MKWTILLQKILDIGHIDVIYKQIFHVFEDYPEIITQSAHSFVICVSLCHSLE